MDRTLLLVGAVAGFIGVGFGAFGAHSLRDRPSPEMLAVFEIGVRYQMYHALAILVTAVALGFVDARLLRVSRLAVHAVSFCSPAACMRSHSPASLPWG